MLSPLPLSLAVVAGPLPFATFQIILSDDCINICHTQTSNGRRRTSMSLFIIHSEHLVSTVQMEMTIFVCLLLVHGAISVECLSGFDNIFVACFANIKRLLGRNSSLTQWPNGIWQLAHYSLHVLTVFNIFTNDCELLLLLLLRK